MHNPPHHTRSLVTLALLAVTACRDITGPSETADLQRNRQRWDASGLSSYTYVVHRDCFCVLGGAAVEVTVRNDVVVSAILVSTGAPLAAEYARFYGTVDDLFDTIEAAIRQHAHKVSAVYDTQYGFPDNVFIDYTANAVDEELGFRVTALTPR